MAKYEYNVDKECFSRVDGRGRPYKINIYEGKRIESLRNMGCSVQKIFDKLEFANDINIHHLRSFIKNMENGDIDVSGDYPAPVKAFEKLNTEARIFELERKVLKIEQKIYEMQSESTPKNISEQPEKTVMDKVKSWMNIIK